MCWACLIVNDDEALHIPISDTLRGAARAEVTAVFIPSSSTWLKPEGPRCGGSRGPHRRNVQLGFSVLQNGNRHQPPLPLCVLHWPACVLPGRGKQKEGC